MKKYEPGIRLLTAFIILIASIAFVVTVEIVTNKKGNKKEYVNYNVFAVTDHNRFFSVTSAVDSFILNLKYKDSDNLMELLDKKYIEKNNITIDNILEKLDIFEETYAVSVRTLYHIKSYNNIYVYYAKAKLYEMNYTTVEHRPIREVFMKITINENDVTFAIAPIDEKEYLDKVGDMNERNKN
jgi:hypothetical protein